MNKQEILDLKLNHYDFDGDITIRGYFKLLLLRLWEEGEGFSGKRPLGNSGWEYDLYKPLVKAGVVGGEIDEDDDMDDIDYAGANKLIAELIVAALEITACNSDKD